MSLVEMSSRWKDDGSLTVRKETSPEETWDLVIVRRNSKPGAG